MDSQAVDQSTSPCPLNQTYFKQTVSVKDMSVNKISRNGAKLLKRRNRNNSCLHVYEVKNKTVGEFIEMKGRQQSGQGDYTYSVDATDGSIDNIPDLSLSDKKIDLVEPDSLKSSFIPRPPPPDDVNRLSELTYDWCNFLFHVYSVLTYCADIISDIVLVVRYYRQGDIIWSSLTLVFVLVPALTMTIFSLYWYWEDRHFKKYLRRSKLCFVYRVVLHLCQLTPVVRYIDLIHCGIKMNLARYKYQDASVPNSSQNCPTDENSELKPEKTRQDYLNKAEKYYKLMVEDEVDSGLLRMIECFMEAAPQLLLQLYLILGSKQVYSLMTFASDDLTNSSSPLRNSTGNDLTSSNWTTFYFQLISCLTSWCAMGWCLTSYHRSLRFSLENKAKLTIKASIFMCLWKLFILSSRIVALVVLALTFHQYVFIILLGHWVLMIFSIWIQQTTFCGEGVCRTGKEFLFIMVISEIYCFEFLNVREGHTRLRYVLYYIIIYLENFGALILWYNFWHPPFSGMMNLTVMYSIIIAIVAGGLNLGILFMLIYYIFYHPTGNIKLCLSLEEIKFWGEYEVTSPPDISTNAQHSSTVVPHDSHALKKEHKSSNGSKQTKKKFFKGWDDPSSICSFQDSDCGGRLASTASQFTNEIPSTYSELEPRLTRV